MTIPLSNLENLNIPAIDNLGKTLQKAKSYDDRQLNFATHQQNEDPISKPVDGLLVPNGPTSRKEKRRSINPALTVSFNKLPSELSRDNPFSSAPNTPYNMNIERPETPTKNEAVPAPFPLREQAPNGIVSSPPSYAHEVDSGRSTHISSLARMQLEASRDRPVFNRSRSASSTDQPASHTFPISTPPTNTPMRMSFTLDRVPQRTTSRPENRNDFSTMYVSETGRSSPQLVPEGRQSPSLSHSSANGRSGPMVNRRSFDNRNRTSTSSLGQTMELPPTPRSASRPTSPAHHVDVPHSIESGTDTDPESEEIYASDSVAGTLPPLPPPKETKGLKTGTRPPQLKLDTIQVETDDRPDLSQVDSEDFSEDFSHEDGSLVESTSHSTYIAPALPPIRFSVVGSDFSDLLNTVGSSHDSAKALEAIATVTGGKIRVSYPNIDVAMPEPVSSVQPRTPTSDRTVAGIDATPVQRRDPNSTINTTPHKRVISPPEPPQKYTEHWQPSAEHSILRSISSPEHRDGAPLSKPQMLYQIRQRERGASTASLAPPSSGLAAPAEITVIPPAENSKSGHIRGEIADIVVRRLKEAIEDSQDRGVAHVKMDTELVDAILSLLKQRQEESHDLKHRLDTIKVSGWLSSFIREASNSQHLRPAHSERVNRLWMVLQ
jgi:Rho-type GTPase-activating protein 1/2